MNVVFLRQAHKFIKKAEKPLKKKLKEEILEIKNNPCGANKLTGTLRGIYAHHFTYSGVQYRIAYKIIDNIIVVAIASRENFYRRILSNF